MNFKNRAEFQHKIRDIEEDIKYYSAKNKKEEMSAAELQIIKLQRLYAQNGFPIMKRKIMINELKNAQFKYHFVDEMELDHQINDLKLDINFYTRKNNQSALNDCELKLRELISMKEIYCDMKTAEFQISMKELEIKKCKQRFCVSSEHQLLTVIAHSILDINFYQRNQQKENEEMEKSKLFALQHLRSLFSDLQSHYFGVGLMYEDGIGIEKNESKAVECYMKAADHGHRKAMYKLGLMYEDGIGIEKNESKAVEWYMKAADRGNSTSMFKLGWMNENGIGTEKNELKAVEWYMKAADHGHSRAMCTLGLMYANGIVIEKNESKAVELYLNAAIHGHVTSMYNLGLMYANGIYVEKNQSKSVEWFKKAADHGNVFAMNNL